MPIRMFSDDSDFRRDHRSELIDENQHIKECQGHKSFHDTEKIEKQKKKIPEFFSFDNIYHHKDDSIKNEKNRKECGDDSCDRDETERSIGKALLVADAEEKQKNKKKN